MSHLAHGSKHSVRSTIPWWAFVAVIVTVGLVIGYLTAPGEWYQSLDKPAFNPPSWVFAPVWTVLYIFIGIAGWRIWRIAPESAAMRLWVMQMILNWCWSPAFFGAQAPLVAFVIICLMLVSIFFFITQAYSHDRWSVVLFVPYAAWVAFAAVLNGSIVLLNQ